MCMVISNVIELLEEHKKEHGDVFVSGPGYQGVDGVKASKCNCCGVPVAVFYQCDEGDSFAEPTPLEAVREELKRRGMSYD